MSIDTVILLQLVDAEADGKGRKEEKDVAEEGGHAALMTLLRRPYLEGKKRCLYPVDTNSPLLSHPPAALKLKFCERIACLE